MKAAASRRNWIRKRAWAALAALVPASECLAVVEGDPSQGRAPAAATAGAGDVAGRDGSDARPRSIIPPPRAFTAAELGALATPSASDRKAPAAPRPRVIVPEKPATVPASPAAPAPAGPALAVTTMAEPVAVPEPADDRPPGLDDALKSLAAGPGDSKASPAATAPKPAPTAPDLVLQTEPEPRPFEEKAAPAEENSPSPVAPADEAPATAAAPEPVKAVAPEPVKAAAPQPAKAVAPEAVAARPAAPAAETTERTPQTPAEAATAAIADAIAGDGKASVKPEDDQVEKATCTTCGTYHRSSDGHVFAGCANDNCIPGRPPCNLPANECNTVAGAFMQNLYQAICCPDPCYQPRWEPAANASLFADYARPRTVTRLRVDRGINMTNPDRNLWFLMQTGPGFPMNVTARRNGQMYRWQGNPSLNWTEMYLYQEAAGEKGSFFVEYPYRQINPLYTSTQAGFGDINFGTKSMMFDTEMLQVAFQFRTYMPSGNASLGLGTGHISLEPSILTSLKLGPETYFQAQVAQWIPLGGSSQIRGGVLSWLMSLNQVLFYTTPDSPVIGTLEMDGWSFQDGGYSYPSFIPQKQTGVGPHGYPKYGPVNPARGGQHPGLVSSGGGVSYFNIGPGVRWSICNKVDIGSAVTFSTTPGQWASPWFRFEVRFLF